ncbi:CvpA family protein [Neolewinella antarctica]|uniref:Membrane protein required for colicin V production n=1 Tax=Neolewinella antarctica TaxID=442734 RepID=A0ABX0XCN6_9BACT|nr:CvpA family protein [Neolewinella antarctica]NJC26598.1 membrane protein required for colicin V production [Neolewinella antarctica]
MAIDIICLIFAAYGFYVGYTKGIISTVLTLASYVVGLLAAMKFGPIAGDMIFESFPIVTKGGGFLLGVVLVFFLMLLLFKLVARGLTGFMETININIVNQLLGGIVSGIFFIFVFSGFVMLGDGSRIITEELKEKSITYQPVTELRETIWEKGKGLFPVFRDFYDKAVDSMDRVRDGIERGEEDSIYDLEE